MFDPQSPSRSLETRQGARGSGTSVVSDDAATSHVEQFRNGLNTLDHPNRADRQACAFAVRGPPFPKIITISSSKSGFPTVANRPSEAVLTNPTV